MAFSRKNLHTISMQFEDFLGEWRDSNGNFVRVSRGERRSPSGELDVELRRSQPNELPAIRLTLKLDHDIFRCGHYQVKIDETHLNTVVWVDMKAKDKILVWERECKQKIARRRSRSQGQSERRRQCATRSSKGSWQCIDRASRSVLKDISTPGAWRPPAQEAEILKQKLLSETCDRAHVCTSNTTAMLHRQTLLGKIQEEKARLLARYALTTGLSEASAPGAASSLSSQPQTNNFGDSEASGALLAAKAKLLIKLQRKLGSDSRSPVKQDPNDGMIRDGGIVAFSGGA